MRILLRHPTSDQTTFTKGRQAGSTGKASFAYTVWVSCMITEALEANPMHCVVLQVWALDDQSR